ncbi:hypothetical protein Dsin_002964 [Dipteronia sinensis]|uniref:Endonuclease/exonuclease/phosphatase domain-containing protein n=1 Tax=Dipteronia sinensis TaxID=43782 RepID=A0AAE0EJS4_9ROSI|nr:hypothetical protein Dsin_002964 [Dipteronia sinensis]
MICVWNVRGAGKQMFSRNIADLCGIFHFEILAVLEPRISGSKALRVINKLGFSNSFVVEAEGFSWGIWLLWNENKVKLQVGASSRHSVTALVEVNSTLWILTVVYANPCVTTRRFLWSYLDAIRSCFALPWLVAGDFNEIVSSSEKRGGRFSHPNSGFSNWIERNELVDLGFIGSKFTWMMKMGIGEEIWERLDRALCSMDWRLHFTEAFVRHLPRILSDHCPVLIQLQSNHHPNRYCKPFKFEAMWLKHKDFGELIHNSWRSQDVNIVNKIHKLSGILKNWNKENFGNLFHNKRRIIARI